jgi:hypothetical protein
LRTTAHSAEQGVSGKEQGVSAQQQGKVIF